jgi:ribonucleoside-diphosphate reductase alpha chain
MEASVEEIEKVYLESWRLGLKAVALYRDGSKRMQPLNFSKKEDKTQTKENIPIRKKLPITRASLTHKFKIANHEGYLTFGLYPDGLPGELFINMSKEGSTIGGLMDMIGTLVSISLQYGVPIDNIAKKFKHQKFEPRGIVFEGDKDIKTAESIIDYIGQFMEIIFVKNKVTETLSVVPADKKVELEKKSAPIKINEELIGELGGFCIICGTQMIKRGKCVEECPGCHYQTQSGCGG